MVILKRSGSLTSLLIVAVFALSGLMSGITYGLDNPDAPDYVADFRVRANVYEQALDNPELTNRGVLIAYDDYQVFLDDERNKAYNLLRSELSAEQQARLEVSRQDWITFRNVEFEFIRHNWTRHNFGSSAGRSRGAYRSSIIKNRVIQLLYYSMNY